MPCTVSTPPQTLITGVILAGGRGSRMGGVDKGLQPYQGKALVAHVAERLAGQVDYLMINANRSHVAYAAFGYPLISDHVAGFAGPLAGLHAALSEARTPLVLTAPCDSPKLPLDLVKRLHHSLQSGQRNLAIAKVGKRLHPVFCLCSVSLLPHLDAYLRGGGRKVTAWCAEANAVEVDFSDERSAFDNFNTPADLSGQ